MTTAEGHCRQSMWFVIVGGFFATMLTCSVAAAEPPTNSGSELRERVEALSQNGARSIGSSQIAAFKFLPKLYAALDYQLAWSQDANVAALKKAVTRSWEDGLMPSDFHSKAFTREGSATEPNARDAIEQDIVMSDALMRLLYQLYFGKVSPNGLDPNWNFARPIFPGDPVEIIASAMKQGKVSELIERARVKHPMYSALKANLQAYTNLEVANEHIVQDQNVYPGHHETGDRVARGFDHRFASHVERSVDQHWDVGQIICSRSTSFSRRKFANHSMA